MSAAHLSTLHAEFSIGLVGLQRHKMPGALNALVSTLAKLKEPIVPTSANTVVREAPDGSVTALKFRHLRARSVEFANQAAFIASVNPHQDPGIFECPEIFGIAAAGTFTAVCPRFECGHRRDVNPCDASCPLTRRCLAACGRTRGDRPTSGSGLAFLHPRALFRSTPKVIRFSAVASDSGSAGGAQNGR